MNSENPFNKPSKNNKEEEIKGDDFVMRKEERAPSRSRYSDFSYDTSVEFRPGESTEEKIKEKEEAEKKEMERTKDFAPADWAEEFFADVLKYKNPYSETFKIKPDGKFDKFDRPDGSPVYSLGHIEEAGTPAEFYQLARDIQKKHPEYQFSFETDPEGKWMKYTVSKAGSER